LAAVPCKVQGKVQAAFPLSACMKARKQWRLANSALQSRGGDGWLCRRQRVKPAATFGELRLPVHEVRDCCGGAKQLGKVRARIRELMQSSLLIAAQPRLAALLTFREQRGPLWVLEAAANCARHGQSRFLAQILHSE